METDVTVIGHIVDLPPSGPTSRTHTHTHHTQPIYGSLE